jgi:Kef-type K+ transport system membrane component KefB
VDFLDAFRSHVLALPDLAKFAVIISAIVGVPRLAVRIGVPPMVGLLLFGVIFGAARARLLWRAQADCGLFQRAGKLLLMFPAGLEGAVRDTGQASA